MRYLKDKARFQVAFKTQITVRHFPLKKNSEFNKIKNGTLSVSNLPFHKLLWLEWIPQKQASVIFTQNTWQKSYKL